MACCNVNKLLELICKGAPPHLCDCEVEACSNALQVSAHSADGLVHEAPCITEPCWEACQGRCSSRCCDTGVQQDTEGLYTQGLSGGPARHIPFMSLCWRTGSLLTLSDIALGEMTMLA